MLTTRRAASSLIAASVLALAFAPATTHAQEWAGSSRTRGVVLTEGGDPIPGAGVKVHWGQDESTGPAPTKTDKKGRWAVAGLREGTFTLTVEAEGYIPWRDQITVFGTTSASERIRLREIPAEVIDAQRREAANELLGKGNDLNMAGDHTGARAAFEEVLSTLDPAEQPTVLHAIANTYVLEENHDAAIGILNSSLEIEPEHADSLTLMVAILAAQGKDAEAAEFTARLPEGAELDPQAQINMGISRYNEGNMDTAAEIFEAVLAAHPDMPEALYFSGLVHLNQQKNEMALTELTRFLELAPDHEKAAEAKDFISYLGNAVGQ